ncbi:chemotaxis protein CheB [Variovorax sp. H27-G14]|uniref:chemotaxis protein CheB n=1 Tax=Variovorax sp. H27-G14 TaxID=3111914 RepID=UPI0038FC55A3
MAVVLHTHATSPRYMAGILDRHSSLPVAYAIDRDELSPGRVYLAPPGTHLVVRQTRRLGLDSGPKFNFHRPTADALFTSAARVFGRQVIGVVLTGGDGDGSRGLQEVKKHGGTSVVQSQTDAQAPGMPINAILHDSPDHVLPLDRLGPLLKTLLAT